MLLNRERPHAFRQYDVTPRQGAGVAADAVVAAKDLQARAVGCDAWAVHVSRDRRRVVTVEVWRSPEAFRRAGRSGDLPGLRPDSALYTWVGTGGVVSTPVTDPAAGVITIDVFRVWWALVGPVSRFNLRNGDAFDRQPGCIGTTVLAGLTSGRIATYARWRTEADFLAAFSAVGGGPAVDSTEAINAFAARRTFGLIRPDYHFYDLLDAHPGDLR